MNGRLDWLGLFGGLAGVTLVVYDQFGTATSSLGGYLFVVLALIGISAGSLYQKRFCAGMDLRTGGFVQLTTAAIVMFFLADHFEGFKVIWTPTLIFASAWLSLVNSIGAISLLYVLMRKGDASKVAGLFHMIPSVTALMSFFVLGESFNGIKIIGFVITALAVYACTHKRV